MDIKNNITTTEENTKNQKLDVAILPIFAKVLIIIQAIFCIIFTILSICKINYNADIMKYVFCICSSLVAGILTMLKLLSGDSNNTTTSSTFDFLLFEFFLCIICEILLLHFFA